jgi:hypothetical protein
MEKMNIINRTGRWFLPALVMFVLTAVAFRLFAPRERGEAAKPSGPETLKESPRTIQSFAVPRSTAVREVRVAAPPAPVRPASPDSKPEPIEIPRVTAVAQTKPDIDALAAAPHVPTYPKARLVYDAPSGRPLTPEEQAAAANTATVVNQIASLKMALLKNDERAARSIVDGLRVYGDIARKGLEVEEENAKNPSLADAFRRIREQLK